MSLSFCRFVTINNDCSRGRRFTIDRDRRRGIVYGARDDGNGNARTD